MQEEYVFVHAKRSIQGSVGFRLLEKLLDSVKNPDIQIRRVLGEIFHLRAIRVCIHPSGNGAVLEHEQNIRTPPTPCMPTAVEHAVKSDRIEFPPSRYG